MEQSALPFVSQSLRIRFPHILHIVAMLEIYIRTMLFSNSVRAIYGPHMLARLFLMFLSSVVVVVVVLQSWQTDSAAATWVNRNLEILSHQQQCQIPIVQHIRNYAKHQMANTNNTTFRETLMGILKIVTILSLDQVDARNVTHIMRAVLSFHFYDRTRSVGAFRAPTSRTCR